MITLELDQVDSALMRQMATAWQRHLMSVLHAARAQGNELVTHNTTLDLRRVDALLVRLSGVPMEAEKVDAHPWYRSDNWPRQAERLHNPPGSEWPGRDVPARKGGPIIDGHGKVLKP